MLDKEKYMKLALKEAQKAAKHDEVPIGAIVVDAEGQVIARAYNWREHNNLATAHAEIRAIEKACRKLKSWRLEGCSIFVTLEPCPMCAGAIMQSRIENVYFSAYDQKGGFVVSCNQTFNTPGLNHYPEWEGGILADDCAQILKDFFKAKRLRNKQKTNTN